MRKAFAVLVLAGTFLTSPAMGAPLDAAKITNDITTMRNNGLTNSAVKYALGLDGITVPDAVLSGAKTVQEAIMDGSMTQGSVPTNPSPPALPPSPTPDLTPQGSSAAGWTPSFTAPTIDSLRGAIMSRPRPPNC